MDTLILLASSCRSIILLTLLGPLLWTIIKYISTSYWRVRNIPYVPPSVIFSKDSLSSLLVTYKWLEKFYRCSNRTVCVGFFKFLKPAILLKSPQVIHSILTKDFKCFIYVRSPDASELNNEPLSQHLLALHGYKWKYLRSKISPIFRPEKLRIMFKILEKCSDNVLDEIERTLGKSIEIRDLCNRVALDSIASCAFGLDLKCTKNESDVFLHMFQQPLKPGFWHNVKAQVRFTYPKFFKALQIKAYKKEVNTFVFSLVDNLIRIKKETENPSVDFVYILMKLLNEHDDKAEGSPFAMKMGDLISAQVFSFFVGGSETTSTTLTCALFEIARHEDVRKKLRDEIDAVIGNDEVTYDNVISLKYLKCVINEVQRLYPPAYMVGRVCSEEYQIPDTDIIIEKGAELIIPIREIHRDPEYFPDPLIFNPERFGPENIQNIVKGSFIPFGDGPRICIGMQFALLELKLYLTKLIRDFDFTLDQRTPSSLEFEEYSRLHRLKSDIHLIFSRRLRNTEV